jgi:aminoglycoside 3-N-acetyltransferase
MSQANTHSSLVSDLTAIGVRAGMILMVHSSLSKMGWTVGGPLTVIRALLEVLGPDGTLAMPGETPQMSDPANTGVFDPLTTPTTMGAIPEAIRTFPGTRRSFHPLVSVFAIGRRAEEITAEHSLEFCEGRGTPFQKLYDLDAHTLLVGVGFNRCTSLHYAESLTPNRRTAVSRFPLLQDGDRVWVAKPDMASDHDTHFPIVGQQFVDAGHVRAGKIGGADSMLFRTRTLVDFAEAYFRRTLAARPG